MGKGMVVAMAASTVLVVATILVHYEVLRLTANHLRDLPVAPRFRILAVVVAAFTAHTLEVWLYGVGYWLLTGFGGIGGLHGPEGSTDFEDCLYFSAVTYSTIGFGEIYPVGHLRLVAGVEALNGLLLIGWSASFTYLAMQEYWPLHETPNGRRAARKA